MPPLNPTQELRATLGGPQRLGAVLGSPQQLGTTLLPSGPRGYSVDYAGIVERDGTMHGPNGWTCAHPSIGVYTITHNLNLDPLAYVVTGTPARGTLDPIDPGKASSIVTFVRDQQANYFVIAVVEGSPAGMAFVDVGFNFTVSPEMLAGDLIPGPAGPPGADSTVPGPPGAPGAPGPEGIPLVVNGDVIGDASSGGSPPLTIQDEGAALAWYPALNFTGAGVAVSVDAPNNRHNVVIAGSSGGISSLTVAAFDAATSGGTVQGGLTHVRMNDGLYECIWNGSAWEYYFASRRVRRPVDSAFSWINQSTSTVTTTSGGVYLHQPATATQYMAIRKRAAPATPYIVTALMIPNAHPTGQMAFGLTIGDGTKQTTFSIGFSGGVVIMNERWNSFSSWDGIYANPEFKDFPLGAPVYLRMADDGANRKSSISFDGFNFRQWHTVSRTDFVTGTEVGFWVKAQNATHDAGVMLVSWEQG